MPESVWDYPRPPRLEATGRRIVVRFGGRTIVDTARGYRVLETSHPPAYYVPRGDVAADVLERVAGRRSFCEWKGIATYWTVRAGGRVAEAAAWSYEDPTPGFADIAGCVSFYASRMDACLVDGERVQAQAGDFYGGWITSDVVGPFKGGPGTAGW
jgi:uncharacterized protein (DUF427 family)